MKAHNFLDNPFMKVMNWAYIALTVSVLFALTNLPLVFCALFLAIDVRNIVFFLVALLPFGCALIAALAVADDFLAKRAVKPAKAYAKYLIRYFRRGLLYWVPALVIAIILVTDGLWFAQMATTGKFLIPLMGVLLLIDLGLVVTLMYSQVRNPDAGVKKVFMHSVYLLARRWYIVLVNAVLLIGIPVLMVIKPQFGMVVTPALLILLIYLNCEFLGKDKLWQRRQKEA